MDRILSLFDEGGTDEVNFNQFVQLLSVFRSAYDVEAFVGGDEAETERQIEKLRTDKMRFVFRLVSPHCAPGPLRPSAPLPNRFLLAKLADAVAVVSTPSIQRAERSVPVRCAVLFMLSISN